MRIDEVLSNSLHCWCTFLTAFFAGLLGSVPYALNPISAAKVRAGMFCVWKPQELALGSAVSETLGFPDIKV